MIDYRLMTIVDYEAAYELWIKCGNDPMIQCARKDEWSSGLVYTTLSESYFKIHMNIQDFWDIIRQYKKEYVKNSLWTIKPPTE